MENHYTSSSFHCQSLCKSPKKMISFVHCPSLIPKCSNLSYVSCWKKLSCESNTDKTVITWPQIKNPSKPKNQCHSFAMKLWLHRIPRFISFITATFLWLSVESSKKKLPVFLCLQKSKRHRNQSLSGLTFIAERRSINAIFLFFLFFPFRLKK